MTDLTTDVTTIVDGYLAAWTSATSSDAPS